MGVVVCGCVVLVFGTVVPCTSARYDVIMGQFGSRGGTVSVKLSLG